MFDSEEITVNNDHITEIGLLQTTYAEYMETKQYDDLLNQMYNNELINKLRKLEKESAEGTK